MLQPHVAGKIVHDLGAGFCQLSFDLIELGAAGVVAIDKEAMPRFPDEPRLTQARVMFGQITGAEETAPWELAEVERAKELSRSIEVAFVSWPRSTPAAGLIELLRRAPVVAYLGKNTDGSACGWPSLFSRELVWREILAHSPERPNTLIVYGRRLREQREPLAEEVAAIVSWDPDSRPMSWDEAQRYDGLV